MAAPVVDHRSVEFSELGMNVLERLKVVFNTAGLVIIYPSSGTGAWEAALVNTLSPGDRVLVPETGHFSELWHQVAQRFGLGVDCIPGTWRHGADPDAVGERLDADTGHTYKAVLVVHNETSTGVTSRIAEIRHAMDMSNHPALLMVDVISSLGSIDYRHDEWGVDVTIAGSQKGLMLPPGLAMNAISQKALEASEQAKCARSYWDWSEMLKSNTHGFFPYTPAPTLL
jgi:alanine-glyoxylate transaminase/serine-glyoxylate transaminase/serine-pyruvate transaminase